MATFQTCLVQSSQERQYDYFLLDTVGLWGAGLTWSQCSRDTHKPHCQLVNVPENESSPEVKLASTSCPCRRRASKESQYTQRDTDKGMKGSFGWSPGWSCSPFNIIIFSVDIPVLESLHSAKTKTKTSILCFGNKRSLRLCSSFHAVSSASRRLNDHLWANCQICPLATECF